MPTLTHLTDFQGTILDALADRAENFDNAAEVADGPAVAYFEDLASEARSTYSRVRAGAELAPEDREVIETALQASEDNCNELGLWQAADEYARAANGVAESF